MDYCWLESARHNEPPTPRQEDPSSDAVILCWARALDVRAQLPEGFTQRVSELSARLGAALGLSPEAVQDLHRGALLHDVGMMQVPDALLRKPGPLTPGEWALIRLHPIFAEEVLGPLPALHAAASVPRYHHERWDGAGYPYGLRASQIPIVARVFAVVSAWSAMTVDRPYRRALAPERALAQLEADAGAAFDPTVVAGFLTLIDQSVKAA